MNGKKLRLLLGLGAAGCCASGVMIASTGLKAMEKFATALVMPCGLLWLLITLLTVLGFARKQWSLSVLSLAAWLVLSLAGNGFVADGLARKLESPYADIDPSRLTMPFEDIIVLGGGGHEGWNGRIQGNDRLVLAAQLYHQGITQKLICTGTKIQALDPDGPNAGEMSAQVLRRLGLPESAIELSEGRNTSEEMKILGERFRHIDGRIGILTSAWHLPRAQRLAKRQGFDPHPLPADFLSEPKGPSTLAMKIESCIPNYGDLSKTSVLVKECLAMAVGR